MTEAKMYQSKESVKEDDKPEDRIKPMSEKKNGFNYEWSRKQLQNATFSEYSNSQEQIEQALTAMFASKTKSKGICSGEAISPAGKRWQMVKMLILVLTPVVILMGITLFFLANSIMERKELNHNKFAIETSTELGRLIKVLQAERDQSVLYLSLLGPETKTYLLERYTETDNTLELLSAWPVNLVDDNGEHFHSKAAFQRYLTLHRRSLDLLLPTTIDEINFYTTAANVLMKWLYNAIVEFRFGSIWNSVVAYQKMIGAAEDAGIERALGGTFFTHEDFDYNANYLWFNEALNTANYNYRSAMKYSTIIKDISAYDNTERYSNLSLFVQNYRKTLQGKMITKTSLKEASLYFDNMTLYVELLFNIQKDLANDIFQKLGEKISSATSDIVVWTLLVVFVIALCPVQIYSIFSQINDIQYYALMLVGQNKELDREKMKTDILLLQMLPKEVVIQLKNNESVTAKYYKNVTLFFSSIDNFAKLSIESSPIQVMNVLEELYMLFDMKIEKYDVYKVETISDQYMVSSGLPKPNGRKHAFEIADLALDIIQSCGTIESLSLPGTKLKIRIGIHSGSAMAGVVGNRMSRFCVFGDTVNTTSRMESNGAADKIHVSSATHNLLKRSDAYVFEKRGKVYVKGKGEMVTFWLLKKTATAPTPNTAISVPTQIHKNTSLKEGLNKYSEGIETSPARMQPAYNNWITKEIRSQNITEKIQQVKEASEPLQKKSIGPSEVGGAKSAHKQTGDGNTLMAKKKITGSTTSSSTGTLTRVEIEHRNDHPLDMDAPEQSVFQDD